MRHSKKRRRLSKVQGTVWGVQGSMIYKGIDTKELCDILKSLRGFSGFYQVSGAGSTRPRLVLLP